MGSGLSLAEAGNQNVDSPTQLDLGARLLSTQVHKSGDGSLHLCHSSCDLLDAGTLAAWLTSIKTWLDANKNDVITLLLVNSDNATPTELQSAFTAGGIADYAYTPTTPGVWPALQDLISANKRLVVFVNAVPSGGSTYLLNEFDHIYENPYNVTGPTGFTCAIDRGTSGTAKLGLMNHLLYTSMAAFGQSIQTPDFNSAETTNSESSLGAAADSCATAWGAGQPWAILLDFVDLGDGVKVVDRLNGVGDASGRKDAAQTYTGGAAPSPAAAAMTQGGGGKVLSVGKVAGLAAGACSLLAAVC